ncbi:2-methylcitrate dehydratase [Phyllosticta citrichinensis]|uniref:2-methylcitrate dehydratase n=1 Tax=Phyllosticta citrichinensis TaxID=1130410 RepID=A0ABR1XJI2_9PEZI
MATKTLAVWAINLDFDSLPASVVEAAARSFHNWAGCAVGGSAHPATAIARKTLATFAGSPTSSMLGSPDKTDAQTAALVNGISSHVYDYDDTHLATVIHPAGPVASALLAAAQMQNVAPVSGEDFIVGLVAGIEAACKVGLAVYPDHYDAGWHITGTAGSIGAAVAVAKLLKLDVQPMQWAIGIAATQVTGLREQFGSMTKSFHPGRAAQNGLLAAMLASNGYDSSLASLEAKRGWASVVSASHKLETVLHALGHTWETEQNTFKPFPCGIVIHPAIDGAIQIHNETKHQDLDAVNIHSVQLSVHPLVLELTGKRNPRTGLEAKFSVYHGAAVGLLFGRAGLAQFADDVATHPTVVHLRDKVRATPDASLRSDEARVRVDFGSGAVSEKHVRHAVGSLEVPMTNEQLEAKFVEQCAPVLGDEGARNASRVCWSLKDANDVGVIAEALH